MSTGIKILEKDLQRRVTDALDATGWAHHHETNSFGTKPGWPDLACFHPEHGTLYLELKVGKNQPTPAQRHWLRIIHAAGNHVAVIRETDHDHHVLCELLTGEFRHLELAGGVYGLEQS